MKIYVFKNKNGEYVKSIFPKASKDIEEISNGIILLIIILVGFLYLIFLD